ncbi:17.7 kDa class I heat shock protein [Striga asiatica]|uniref:17.7 kDa class I heat shock protein n=1 Tax=Striga asiatica TaxID=4170 RepID=A0A5A7NWI5_STRAF|nr:17.7 kDa class I heat shock protein [Striga asiatica]
MKVHPMPRMRGNLTLRYDVASALAQASGCRQKKLRRLPHIFAKVLELPFRSDADVSIDETPGSLRFTAATDDIGGGVWADAIEIHPGVTKIVVRGGGVADLSGTELELDLWRFRLPASTRPELASAAYDDGELVVTVPKGAATTEEDEEDDGGTDEDGPRLVIVQ